MLGGCVEPEFGGGGAAAMAPVVGIARQGFESMRAETAPRIVDREGEAVVSGVFVGVVVVPEDVIAD